MLHCVPEFVACGFNSGPQFKQALLGRYSSRESGVAGKYFHFSGLSFGLKF